jgi:hypothetical protein
MKGEQSHSLATYESSSKFCRQPFKLHQQNANDLLSYFPTHSLNTITFDPPREAINLENLYSLEEAGEQIYNQVGAEPKDWNYQKLKAKRIFNQLDSSELKERAKKRLESIINHFAASNS